RGRAGGAGADDSGGAGRDRLLAGAHAAGDAGQPLVGARVAIVVVAVAALEQRRALAGAGSPGAVLATLRAALAQAHAQGAPGARVAGARGDRPAVLEAVLEDRV